jgi:Sas10/Utp3/C1D family
MSSSPSHTEQRLYHQQDLLLLETTQKVEASLQQAIHEHVVSSTELFSPAQGLDFLDVKNSLLLSYLIELVYDFRNRLMHQEHQHQQHDGDDDGKNGGRNAAGRNDASLHRLIVMRTVLDKMRGLDKKLRYQVRCDAMFLLIFCFQGVI